MNAAFFDQFHDCKQTRTKSCCVWFFCFFVFLLKDKWNISMKNIMKLIIANVHIIAFVQNMNNSYNMNIGQIKCNHNRSVKWNAYHIISYPTVVLIEEINDDDEDADMCDWQNADKRLRQTLRRHSDDAAKFLVWWWWGRSRDKVVVIRTKVFCFVLFTVENVNENVIFKNEVELFFSTDETKMRLFFFFGNVGYVHT